MYTEIDRIGLLEAIGVNVQKPNSGVNYTKSIEYNSEAFRKAVGLVEDLIKSYGSLRALVQTGFRTPQNAAHEYMQSLRRAKSHVKDWRKVADVDKEVIYLSETLEERLTQTLRQLGSE